jgi:hypothetical protein
VYGIKKMLNLVAREICQYNWSENPRIFKPDFASRGGFSHCLVGTNFSFILV